MSTTSDIIIIGGGAVGICSAYYLHKCGYEVTLLERGQVCSGSSHGNAGLVVPSHSVPLAAPGIVAKGIKWMFDPDSPFYIKPRLDKDLISWLWQFWLSSAEGQMRRGIPLLRDLSLSSVALFDELNTLDDLSFGYEKKGLLDVYNTEEGLEEGIAEAELLRPYGIETIICSADDVQALSNGLKIQCAGGVHYMQDAHIMPQKFVGDLASYLRKNGVYIHECTEVLGFDSEGGKVTSIQTTKGAFVGREVIVTAGSWAYDIGNMLGVRLPIQPAKGYSITVKRPQYWPEIPMVMAEAKVGVTPMMETLRFAGTLELAGFDHSINRRRVNAIMRAIPQYLPDIKIEDLEIMEIWRGMRPCTPDGLPFLGRPQACKNVIVAAGHAMIGVSLGPITGKLVSQMVDGQSTDIDITALNVDRFN